MGAQALSHTAAAIQRALQAKSSLSCSKKMAVYMKGSIACRGVPMPEVRAAVSLTTRQVRPST